MNAINKFVALAALLVLTGCSSLLPKNVEFFQKKVEAAPASTGSQKETQKEAAALAAAKAEQTYRAAIAEDTTTNVLEPAADSALLSRSVSTSLGPPVSAWDKSAKELASKLDTAVAKLDKRMDKFTEANDKNEGKKIEGTGLFQIPYFLWIAIIALVIFVGAILLKVFLTVASIANPGVAVGTRVASMGASVVAKGFSQMVKGGEDFKAEIVGKLGEPASKIVLDLFAKHHQQAQDQDVQSAIKALTS